MKTVLRVNIEELSAFITQSEVLESCLFTAAEILSQALLRGAISCWPVAGAGAQRMRRTLIPRLYAALIAIAGRILYGFASVKSSPLSG
jgi:hypothetical protein